MTDMIAVAKAIRDLGYSPVACGDDKAPIGPWKQYQKEPMSDAEIARKFRNGARLGIVCGKVSGNLECIDIDEPSLYEPFIEMLELQRPGMSKKLLHRQTPSGGYHLVYRSEKPVAGNQKLAMQPGVDENGKPTESVLIETRGEGGQFLSPPSEGYVILQGSLKEISVLTADEVDTIHSTARAFDRCYTQKKCQNQTQYNDAPGDDYNQANLAEDILLNFGWKKDRRTTAGQGMTRPGKEQGTSAVVFDDTNKVYVFSTNAYPLEDRETYSPFAVYTMYEHNGDFSAAAAQLRKGGYGSTKTEQRARITPKALPDELSPVAPFDLELLPDSLRAWASDICERMQCPPDYVAVGFMTGLASLLGRKIGIRPQRHDDWTVVPNMWSLVVGRPGVMKSPALEATIAPLKRLAAEASKAHETNKTEYQRNKTIEKLRMEAAEKTARKLLEKDPETDLLAVLTVDEVAVPTLKRYIANDTSPASLGELLRQNPNGLLVYRDELVSLLKSLDREDQADGRGFYLTGWNGDSAYTFDRIGRGLNLSIEAVCISILGGTQPGRLSEYIRHAVKGGSADDGLIQRFGLLVWPDSSGTWKNFDRKPDNKAKNEAFRVFDRLDKIESKEIGAQQDTDIDGNLEGLPYLRFDNEGQELFSKWRADLERMLRGDELHPALESHFAKYRKLIPALALINHLADGGIGPVGGRATLQALAWSEYLETHARRAYTAASQPAVSTAKAIISKIKTGTLVAPFSSRDVWRPGWSKLSDRDQAVEALRLLCDYDWLYEERVETGGRHATQYHITEW